MSDQEDFKSPEEIQADLNQAKINGAISNIGWQFVIFAVVIYATYYNNWVADLLLTGYGWLLGLSCVIFFFVIVKPIDKLAVSSAMKSKMLLSTPTAIVLRAIGTVFSIVEISILISFDYTTLAGIWAAAEVF